MGWSKPPGSYDTKEQSCATKQSSFSKKLYHYTISAPVLEFWYQIITTWGLLRKTLTVSAPSGISKHTFGMRTHWKTMNEYHTVASQPHIKYFHSLLSPTVLNRHHSSSYLLAQVTDLITPHYDVSYIFTFSIIEARMTWGVRILDEMALVSLL
jgi:hypothetical protein